MYLFRIYIVQKISIIQSDYKFIQIIQVFTT